MLRHSFDHPIHGDVVIEQTLLSGAVAIEFERLESEDAIIPQYRMALTAEHVAAWIQWVLTHCYGRRCSLHSEWGAETHKMKKGDRGRLHAMLRQTEMDANTAHCIPSGPHVVLIRGGRVLKVRLCLDATMGEFGRCLNELENIDDKRSVAREFVDFVHGLMFL